MYDSIPQTIQLTLSLNLLFQRATFPRWYIRAKLILMNHWVWPWRLQTIAWMSLQFSWNSEIDDHVTTRIFITRGQILLREIKYSVETTHISSEKIGKNANKKYQPALTLHVSLPSLICGSNGYRCFWRVSGNLRLKFT